MTRNKAHVTLKRVSPAERILLHRKLDHILTSTMPGETKDIVEEIHASYGWTRIYEIHRNRTRKIRKEAIPSLPIPKQGFFIGIDAFDFVLSYTAERIEAGRILWVDRKTREVRLELGYRCEWPEEQFEDEPRVPSISIRYSDHEASPAVLLEQAVLVERSGTGSWTFVCETPEKPHPVSKLFLSDAVDGFSCLGCHPSVRKQEDHQTFTRKMKQTMVVLLPEKGGGK